MKQIEETENDWIELENLKKQFLLDIDEITQKINDDSLLSANEKILDAFPSFISKSELFSETEKDRMTFGRNIKNIQNEDRKKERYARHFIGKLIKKKENKEYDIIEGHYLTGALFELGLVKGKRIKKKKWGRTLTGQSYKNVKNTVYVTPTDIGLEFAKLKNPVIDLLNNYDLGKNTAGKIATSALKLFYSTFSDEEITFYQDEILSKFEFEREFVRDLIKKEHFEKSIEIQKLFEEKYFSWLEDKYPSDYEQLMGRDEKSKSSFIRIHSLVIMARLVELDIFVKKAGTKLGPYYLRDKRDFLN